MGVTRSDLPLYFLHIPRTGGTSLSAAIQSRFRPGDVFPGRLLDALANASRAELGAYKYFTGHFGLVLPSLLDWRVRGVTVVRDPFDALLSRFGYILDEPTNPLHEHVRRPGYTFSSFLRDPICQGLVSNWQSRWLALPPPPFVWGSVRPPEMRVALEDVPQLVSDDEMFQRANDALDRLDVVGVTRRLRETLSVVDVRMGWRRPTQAPKRLNVSSHRPGRSDITDADRRLIDQANEVDRAVFSLAQARLDDAIRDLPRLTRTRLSLQSRRG